MLVSDSNIDSFSLFNSFSTSHIVHHATNYNQCSFIVSTYMLSLLAESGFVKCSVREIGF